MKVLLIAAALLLAAAPAARAQDGAYVPSVLFSTSALDATRDVREDRTDRRPAAQKARPASLAYATPSAALKAQTVQGYVNRLRAKNPAASQAVAANLGPGKHDYGQIYRGIVQGTGLREHDAADNLAAFLVLGWMIVNDVPQVSGLPAGAPQGVRAQFAPKLAANAQLAAPGAAAQLGEEMKLLFVVVQGGWQSALKENTLPAYRQGVAALFQNQYGLDFAKVKLTAQGFVKK